MVAFNSFFQLRFVLATNRAGYSNRRLSSIARTGSLLLPQPVAGHVLSSGDTIPAVGLGTWRASDEDVGKAIKVDFEWFNWGSPEG